MKDILTKLRVLWARKRILNESTRGGAGRLLVIALIGFGMIGLVIAVSMKGFKAPVESQIAKMPAINPLPGGLQGDPAQDALLVRHSQDEAAKAAHKNESYTPAMPASVPLKVVEPGADVKPSEVPAVAAEGQGKDIVLVQAPPPVFVPPEETARIEEVAAQGDDPEMKRAMADMFAQWQGGPPRTEMIQGDLPRTNVQGASVSGSAAGRDGLEAAPARRGQLLVPAGRGIYAHTIVAVDSDTNGPIILEADTGPLAGDRMIGIFTKNAGERLIVRVNLIEHRGQTLEARGLLIAPDTMETSVATSVDPHFVERWALPAAAAFMSGLGQAVALSNSSVQTTPYGGVIQSYGSLNFQKQAEIAGGTAAQQVGQTLMQDMPKGPTVKLAANAIVGVMFLSDVTLPAPLVTK